MTTGKLSYHELIQDISLGGAYIETHRKLPLGEALVLWFTFPSYQESIALTCRVVRNDGKGIGIQFTDTLPDAVVSEVLGVLPTPRISK